MVEGMDAHELLDKKVDEYRQRWSEVAAELVKELERLEWLAETLGVPLPPLPCLPTADAEAAPSTAVRPGQFFSMSQPDAAASYLNMVRRPCALDELLEALQQGGIVFQGKDARGTLYTQLVRATMRFVKLPTGEFDLLERYPNEMKRRKPKKGGVIVLRGEPDDESSNKEDDPSEKA